MQVHDFSCKNCGAAMENSRFCEYCGAKFETGEAPGHLPDPNEKNTVFIVNDVFKITKRGNVLMGKVTNERISVGETFTLADSAYNPIQDVTIVALEVLSRKKATSAEVGEEVGLAVDDPGVQAKAGMLLFKK